MSKAFDASIVIPTFNRAGLLPRAIESALSQSVECEVIVCDHGSSDNTSDVVNKYGDKVVYVRRERDNGPIFCWLDGILSASSEYVHITYDDDWIDPRFIECCLNVFDERCAFVFTDVEVHHEGGENISLFSDWYTTGQHGAADIEKKLLNMELTISPGCGVFRKKDVISALLVGGVPEEPFAYHGAGPDMLMYLIPLLHYSHFGFVNEKLAHFLGHPDSITIDAGKKQDKINALKNAYMQAKKYYLVHKYAMSENLGDCLYRKVQVRNKLFRIPGIVARRVYGIVNGKSA